MVMIVINNSNDNNNNNIIFTDIATTQTELWSEALAEDPTTEADARQGELVPTNIDPRLLHDIQVTLARLIGKASKLIGNVTTNLAECWMHV